MVSLIDLIILLVFAFGIWKLVELVIKILKNLMFSSKENKAVDE